MSLASQPCGPKPHNDFGFPAAVNNFPEIYLRFWRRMSTLEVGVDALVVVTSFA